MVEAWSSSYTSSWSYHTCQKHVKDLPSPIFCCHLKMVAQEPDRTSCFARVVGPPNGAWWESHWNPLKSIEGHCESMWLAFEMTDLYGFLMFEMMYPWWSIGLECRWNSLKTMFLISICQFWRQQGRPEGSLFLVKLHHPQDSRGSPRYGMFAVIFSHATVNYAEKSSRNEAPTCPVHWQ